MSDIWAEVRAERERAHAKHGAKSMESYGRGNHARLAILMEEVGEVAREFNEAALGEREPDWTALRAELIQVAAMAGAWADACSGDDWAVSDVVAKSGHVMRVVWDGDDVPTYTVVCNEPPGALCRAQFPCDCEVYGKVGIDDEGPWHDTYDWGGSEHETRRHRGEPGGECTYALWINNGDCADELGHGTVDLPATFTWDGDGYEWHVGGAPC